MKFRSIVLRPTCDGAAQTTIFGLRLRSIRTGLFGPRIAGGGRPGIRESSKDFPSWVKLLTEEIGIGEATAQNWMRLADAAEILAEREGLSLRETCEKLPWDWTPEETRMLETTVQQLAEGKTQRELLQISKDSHLTKPIDKP